MRGYEVVGRGMGVSEEGGLGDEDEDGGEVGVGELTWVLGGGDEVGVGLEVVGSGSDGGWRGDDGEGVVGGGEWNCGV